MVHSQNKRVHFDNEVHICEFHEDDPPIAISISPVNSDTHTKQRVRDNKAIYWIIFILILLFSIAFVYYFFVRPRPRVVYDN